MTLLCTKWLYGSDGGSNYNFDFCLMAFTKGGNLYEYVKKVSNMCAHQTVFIAYMYRRYYNNNVRVPTYVLYSVLYRNHHFILSSHSAPKSIFH